MRLGSLFSGYGGLELAVGSLLGTSTAWVSDIDPGACKILAHRYPDTWRHTVWTRRPGGWASALHVERLVDGASDGKLPIEIGGRA